MSRYYKIDLFAPSNTGTTPDETYTSFPNGKIDPNALTVEMDVTVVAFGAPDGSTNPYLRIWGIPLGTIYSAGKYNPKGNTLGYGISVYGGMQKGLPLADPSQAGLLFNGTVQQALGNWIELDQTLDFYIIAANTSALGRAPVNLSFNWKKGTPLGTAIQNTLKVAFPNYEVNVTGCKQILNYDTPGYYENVVQFADMIQEITLAQGQEIYGPDYQGVKIWFTNKTFYVDDFTQPSPAPTAIAFKDLIGQPAWIDSVTLQFKCVMRYDLVVGSLITMPKGIYTTTQASNSFTQDQSIQFQGTFQITVIRHVGNSRQPDAASWVTVFNAITKPVAAGDTSSLAPVDENS